MKTYSMILMIGAFLVASANAQFPIKLPKIKLPEINKAETGKVKKPIDTNKPSYSDDNLNKKVIVNYPNRQMVMDDGYTFFIAEMLGRNNAGVKRDKNNGWYLNSQLRMLGTFPKRSAFRIVVKKSGRELMKSRCRAKVYTKSTDTYLNSPGAKKGKDLNYDDSMSTFQCYGDKKEIKAVGKMSVEVHFIDGDTDAEKLVRTYKIDVHRATRVSGPVSKPIQTEPEYYIQRHAEAAVAFIHVQGNHTPQDNRRSSYFLTGHSHRMNSGQLSVYMSHSPGGKKKYRGEVFTRCSVNGQRINLPSDEVSISAVKTSDFTEMATYTDRIATKFKRGSAYKDRVEFTINKVTLPLYEGEQSSRYKTTATSIAKYPGKWECSIRQAGETLRIFRWEVGSDGKIVPHAEQQNGNINLFYKTYLIDVEIPAGRNSLDYRTMPMPNAGLFYGIPWSSSEGKATAAKVPRKGNPYHVPSNRAKP